MQCTPIKISIKRLSTSSHLPTESHIVDHTDHSFPFQFLVWDLRKSPCFYYLNLQHLHFCRQKTIGASSKRNWWGAGGSGAPEQEDHVLFVWVAVCLCSWTDSGCCVLGSSRSWRAQSFLDNKNSHISHQMTMKTSTLKTQGDIWISMLVGLRASPGEAMFRGT